MLEIIDRLAGNHEFPVAHHLPEALYQPLVPGIGGRAVAMPVAGVETAQRRRVMQTFVIQNAVRLQIQTLPEFPFADLQILVAAEAHGDEPAGGDFSPPAAKSVSIFEALDALFPRRHSDFRLSRRKRQLRKLQLFRVSIAPAESDSAAKTFFIAFYYIWNPGKVNRTSELPLK